MKRRFLKSRYERLLEVIDYLKKNGVTKYNDPRVPKLVEKYLRVVYGFNRITIQDYIKTVQEMMKEM